MKAIDRPFTKIINGTTQFVIPVFQRDYSWTESQCSQLWEDVLAVAGTNGERGHFLGSFVYVGTGDNSAGFTRWLLIDGQQRLTTLTLLLIALRDHIHQSKWKGTETDPTPRQIEAYFLVNAQEEGPREQKLVLRRNDHDTLMSLIKRAELPESSSERIKDNYDFFRERLLNCDPAEIYRGIGRLVVVDVALDHLMDDPQLIFESLNSTGIDLSQSDLIRNFILMKLPEREQTRHYENYWSKIEALFRAAEGTFDSFARDYVALKTASSKQEKATEIYYAFRRFFPEFQRKLGGLENTFSDMLRYARYYAAFALGRETTPELEKHFERIRHLVDVPAVLVMRLYERYDQLKTLSEDEFLEALGLIESYVLRRAVCGYQTRGYWQVFANLAYKIGDTTPLLDLKVAFARLHETNRFPPNEQFERELRERDLYGLRVCRQLLDRLENHDTKEPTDTAKCTIEHVMPQNEKLSAAWRSMLGVDWRDVHKTWLHRLGNLTLTGYNSEYQDSPFEKKKTVKGGFSESSLHLNRFVRDQSVWTAVEIEKRTNHLAEISLKVWPPLTVSAAAVASAAEREMHERAKKHDVAKVKMSPAAKALFDQLRSEILALDSKVVELAEANSVSYHGPAFFLEVLPRRHKLSLLLPLDFNEVDDSSGFVQDASQWKFFVNAKYEGGVYLSVSDAKAIGHSVPFIRKAYGVSCQ